MHTHPEPNDVARRLSTSILIRIGVIIVAALLAGVAATLLVSALPDAQGRSAWLGTILVLDLALALVAARVVLRRLVDRRFDDLKDTTAAVARGELVSRPSGERADEVGVVGHMLARIAEHWSAERSHRARAERLASVGRLAAGIAHEIGNPLGAINAYAHVLGSRAEHNAEARVALEGIERESDRIDRIVRGLLEFARPRPDALGAVDVNETLRSAVRLLEGQGLLRRTTIVEELDVSSPLLLGQEHQLEQAFVNLLLNAVDAMPGGGRIALRTHRIAASALESGMIRRADDPPLTIRPRAHPPRLRLWLERGPPPAEVVRVIIADSGPGVPPEDSERIFDPFYTTKQPDKGTGLGLAIVASIVDSLNGAIWVERAREGGAAFHMLFPVAVGLASPSRRVRATA